MLSIFNNVQEIRILPLNKTKEFNNQTIEEVQQNYFSYQLPILHQGIFKYKKSGLDAQEPALILFQYDNHIVAVAVLREIEKFSQPEQDYAGAFYFDVSSIAVLTPLTYNDLASVFPGLRSFSNEKQKLDRNKLRELITFLTENNIQFVWSNYFTKENEEQFQKNLSSIPSETTPDEPILPKKSTIGSRTVTPRDPRLSKGALESANYQCEYDSSHQYFRSENTNQNYVEAHHLIPLSKQHQFSHSLDVSANIVSLCPVCHRIIHHAPAGDREPIIKRLFNLRQKKLEKAGIVISLDEILDLYC